jgi:hypothetical protein
MKLTTVSRSRMVELYLYSPIRLHGAVLNRLSTWTLLPVTFMVWHNISHPGGTHIDSLPENFDADRIFFVLPSRPELGTVLEYTITHAAQSFRISVSEVMLLIFNRHDADFRLK